MTDSYINIYAFQQRFCGIPDVFIGCNRLLRNTAKKETRYARDYYDKESATLA